MYDPLPMSNVSIASLLDRLVSETGAQLVQLANGERRAVTDIYEACGHLLSISPLQHAVETDVSFISNARFRDLLNTTGAGLVIMSEGFSQSDYQGFALLHANPYWVYAKLSCLYQEATRACHRQGEAIQEATQIADSAVVEQGAVIGKGCMIDHGVVIKAGAVLGDYCSLAANSVVAAGVRIGARARVSMGVRIQENCLIGDDVFLDASAVIGSEGFGYAPHHVEGALRWQRIAQLGRVVLGDRVSIGANTTIDRGALEDTVIGDDVIIDNQVQVAHNTRIGNGTAIAGCVGIAGSSTIGERCSIGGGVGIAGHLSIADDTVVLGMTLVNKSINDAGVYASGTGVQPADQWRKSAVRFTQLEKLFKRVKSLES